MSHQQDYASKVTEYSDDAIDSVRQEKFARRTARPTHGRKRGKTPQSFNGIHRRRRRKVAW